MGYGVESLILENDDILDLSEAQELKCVYINNSNKYMVENGVLYEKDKNGKKGNEVNVPHQIQTIDKTDRTEKEKIEKETNVKNEYQKMFKEYSNKRKEFMTWKNSKNIANNDDTTKEKNTAGLKLCGKLKSKFDVNKAEEFIKLAKETMYMMDKFKQEYEDYEFAKQLQEELNN